MGHDSILSLDREVPCAPHAIADVNFLIDLEVLLELCLVLLDLIRMEAVGDQKLSVLFHQHGRLPESQLSIWQSVPRLDAQKHVKLFFFQLGELRGIFNVANIEVQGTRG